MSTQREWSADGYVTRRQLRAAARAAQTAATPTPPAGSASTTGTPVSATSAGEAAPSDAPAPLTRRQIRERERAEGARRRARSAAVERDAGAGSPGSAGAPPDALQHPGATGDEPVLPEQVAARAADQPKQERRKPVQKAPARRWLPRLAVLGALAAVTTVVPLTGAALPGSSSDESTGAPLGATSALEVFSAGGTQLSSDTSAALAADPLASLRSMVATSRSNDRDTTTCGAGAMEANGVLASEVEMAPPEIVMPLAEGSFHYTSRYGLRSHPIFGGYGEHTGLDMAAAAGTPIHAAAEGTVVHAGAGMDGRSSMLVIIEHEVDGQHFWTWYVHMYPDGVYVSEGQQVNAGDVIGAVGSYGNSTGPHLHFEVHLDQDLTTVDPESWLAENAVPLDSETLRCTQG
ncbi:peptidoglycan DD-metalloendopeptidase family protein [Ruania albidiflava]|uniref:peptidoglycan DD-metalloendopeptidase family protein n=1 Tax=Ruania albidiflava TaxID=366586 RepID=UPI0023F0A9A9|nr:peptidoglycan DD-metalloendopeptidase family protein [Ruania albidiflava]